MSALKPLHRGDTGDPIAHLQAGVNKTLGDHSFDWRKVKVDGTLGDHTLHAANMAGWLQGLSRAQLQKINGGTITVHAQQILRHERKRTPAMHKAEEGRKAHAAKLRKQHAESNDPSAPGTTTFDGLQVANWFVPWIQKIRDRGKWTGHVVSGFRTPEYSESLCYAMCGAPTCPGRCAGKNTNHACPPSYKCGDGEGAIDVSDYFTFASEAAAVGAPFHNDLPSDRVHFSRSGH